MTYVDKYGRNDHINAFIWREDGCARRYRVKYGRCVVAKGGIWGRIAELQIDRVASQSDILERQLSDDDIPNALRGELRNELGGILKRRESARSEEGVDQKKRHR